MSSNARNLQIKIEIPANLENIKMLISNFKNTVPFEFIKLNEKYFGEKNELESFSSNNEEDLELYKSYEGDLIRIVKGNYAVIKLSEEVNNTPLNIIKTSDNEVVIGSYDGARGICHEIFCNYLTGEYELESNKMKEVLESFKKYLYLVMEKGAKKIEVQFFVDYEEECRCEIVKNKENSQIEIHKLEPRYERGYDPAYLRVK